MRTTIKIGFVVILLLSLFVIVFGGGKDLYEMLEGLPIFDLVVITIPVISLLAIGYGIAIILITWIQALIRWLKK
jgi:hypothetical protein